MDILEFLASLPQSPTPRAFATWEEYEAFLREEKNSWEREVCCYGTENSQSASELDFPQNRPVRTTLQ